MNISSNASEMNRAKVQEVAIDDLMEVEACLRDLLQSSQDPAVLQRLYNLHREIQRYLSELPARKQ